MVTVESTLRLNPFGSRSRGLFCVVPFLLYYVTTRFLLCLGKTRKVKKSLYVVDYGRVYFNNFPLVVAREVDYSLTLIFRQNHLHISCVNAGGRV